MQFWSRKCVHKIRETKPNASVTITPNHDTNPGFTLVYIFQPLAQPKTPLVMQTMLFHVRRRQCLYNTGTVLESCFEDSICVLEHTILKTDDNELRALKSSFDKTANVLRM